MSDTKQGFKNAPELTEFRRGMVVYHTDPLPKHTASQEWTMDDGRSAWTLDRDGVWEGQRRKTTEGTEVEVKALTDDMQMVHYMLVDTGVLATAPVGWFKKRYPTVVWSAPQKRGSPMKTLTNYLKAAVGWLVDAAGALWIGLHPDTWRRDE